VIPSEGDTPSTAGVAWIERVSPEVKAPELTSMRPNPPLAQVAAETTGIDGTF